MWYVNAESFGLLESPFPHRYLANAVDLLRFMLLIRASVTMSPKTLCNTTVNITLNKSRPRTAMLSLVMTGGPVSYPLRVPRKSNLTTLPGKLA